ncbi:hypothetical protein [Mesorhizobium carmichaelinearum]|uniref:hypothetical protein n=1 Tax=Mesorhizobium carmichaelinearum TaxID=1208188 RepID=UPI0015C76F24|nr:hypothetical protein [Mesorhizobium carmichaelinearum]
MGIFTKDIEAMDDLFPRGAGVDVETGDLSLPGLNEGRRSFGVLSFEDALLIAPPVN